jgi:hypothetical protein
VHQLRPRHGAGHEQSHQERGQPGAVDRSHRSPNVTEAADAW